MFAKLTSIQVLRHTRPGRRPVPMLRVAPTHANDNHVTHSSAGAAGRPVLTCRWVPSAAGGFECRWFIAGSEDTPPSEPGGGAFVQQPVTVGGPRLALIAG
jgi:hypothetical protein